MTEQAERFGIVLYELDIPGEMVRQAEQVFRENPALLWVLASPVVQSGKKHRILRRVMAEMNLPGKDTESFTLFLHFLYKVCDDGGIPCLDEIFKAWIRYGYEQEGVLEAELYYVTEPDEGQLAQLKEFLCRRYDKKEVILHTGCRPELLGGFVLRAGDVEFDYSLAGRMKKLRRAVVDRQA